MKSGAVTLIDFPSSFSGAEVALLTDYGSQAHFTGGCSDSFGGFRVLRAAGNDESDP